MKLKHTPTAQSLLLPLIPLFYYIMLTILLVVIAPSQNATIITSDTPCPSVSYPKTNNHHYETYKKTQKTTRELKTLRPMLQETHLQADDLVLPVFVNELNTGKEPINAMPEVYRWSLSSLIDQIETWYDSGLKAFALFPCISEQKMPQRFRVSKRKFDFLPSCKKNQRAL